MFQSSQILNNPFKNSLLYASLTSDKRNKQHHHSESEIQTLTTQPAEQCSLNYSNSQSMISHCLLNEQSKHTQEQSAQFFKVSKLLSGLLLSEDTHEDSMLNNSNIKATQFQKQQETQLQMNSQYENKQDDMDYSSQISELKNKMIQIQSLAQVEIQRLKKELYQQSLKAKQLSLHKIKQTKEASTNTQIDDKEELIKALKDSLIEHIKLNRQLLNKDTIDLKQNMQNVINNVQLNSTK